MHSLTIGHREQQDERAAPPVRYESTDDRSLSQARLRIPVLVLVIVIGVAGSMIATRSSPLFAIEPGVSGPAGSGSAGLQTARRLTPPVGPVLDSDVQEILDLVNAERAARGTAPLTHHVQLTEAALAHAADQFGNNCLTSLSHTGTDGSNPGQRIARTGLRVRTWGENIACNQQSPAQVMQSWMNSEGHRQNILNTSFTHIGISITRDSGGRLYWVEVFGTPR